MKLFSLGRGMGQLYSFLSFNSPNSAAMWSRGGSQRLLSPSIWGCLLALLLSVPMQGMAQTAMTSPTSGSTLPGSSATFNWTLAEGVTNAGLWVGTTAGASDLYFGSPSLGPITTTTVSGLPMNGSTVYVRLWAQVAGNWQSIDYTYKAAAVTQTAMTSPTSGSTLPGSSATFNWTLAAGVTNAGLWVGTTAGASDLYFGSPSLGPITTTTVSGLPMNGSTVYVRLWAQVAGNWQSIDYTYKAAAVTQTAMTSPTSGSTLPGSSATFNWTLAEGVTNAGLWVGTTAGASDLYFGSPSLGPITTTTVSGLPMNGSTVYVRLWAQVAGNWQSIDYTYKAAAVTQTAMTSPTSGSTLPGSSATFNWTLAAGVTNAGLWVGTTAGASDLYFGSPSLGPITTTTVSGLPMNGSTVYVRLWAQVAGNWQSIDYTYIASGSSQTGYTVNGQIYSNGCGGGNLPPITITLSTTPPQTTTTDGSGNYSFQNVPNGTYTVTPSITGASSLFSPASQSVTVNNGGTGVNGFSGAVAYTVSGSVSYSGKATGQVYLTLNGNNCGGTTLGSILQNGSFVIHGVPPGTYTLQAWMDNLGNGAQNASNPTGSTPNVTVSNGNVTSAAVTLTDPSPVTLGSSPTIKGVSAIDGGAVIQYKGIVSNGNNNGNGVEQATSYNVQWSTDPTFESASTTKNFAATGTNGTNLWFVNGLTDGTQLYFRAQGVVGDPASPTSASSWATFSPMVNGTPTITAVTIGAPSAPNTVSGNINFTVPRNVTSGPIYVGFYDQNTGNIYGTSFPSGQSSPLSYSVQVPTGSNYYFFGVIDQNNDGMVDAGDITNTNDNGNQAPTVITGITSGENLTLASGNSTVTLTTQHVQSPNQNGPGTNDSYNLSFDVRAGNKLPVAVELVSGPNVLTPMDIGECANCGKDPFNFWVSFGATRPTMGAAYGLQVTYSDGSFETLPATVSTVLDAFATNLSPTTGSSSSVTPTFTWTYPTNASNYTYQFQLMDSGYNTIWQIPGNNSNSNGFSNSVTSITWNADPLGGNNLPSPNYLCSSALCAATNYTWQIQTQDSNGNSAQAQVSYQPANLSPLSLPNPGSNPLPSATVGQSYAGTINASGGAAPYTFTVNGNAVTGPPVSLGNGSLAASITGGNALFISGTPTNSGNVSFGVQVTDSTNGNFFQQYSINVSGSGGGAGAGLSLTPNLLSATAEQSYSGAINASGGGPSYSFTVNGNTVPTNGSPITLGGGLTASNSGGDTLSIGGTPQNVGIVTFSVSVSSNGATVNTVTYSITVGGSATLQSITVAPANPSIPAGAINQFTATGTYSDGTSRNITSSVLWSSGTTSVATVAPSGLATSTGAGSALITATSGGISGSTMLTVTAATLQSVSVTPVTPIMATNSTKQFTATGTYSDGTSRNITSSVLWSSGTTSVATVAPSGLATSIGAGSSVIKATSGSISGSTTLTVTAATLQSIAVVAANPSIPAGLTTQFTATGTYSDGTSQNITSSVIWSSGTTSVATIAVGGLATSIGIGSANITATLGSISGGTALTVTPATLQSIAVATTGNPSIPAGLTMQFTATGTYSDGTSQNITSSVAWSSDTTSVAIIAPSGLAISIGAGSAGIIATSGNIVGSTTLTVTTATLQSIAVAATSNSMPTGLTLQFAATGVYSDGTSQNITSLVTWSSDATSVATIAAGGLATGVGVGSADITAASGDISGGAALTVTGVTLQSIAITPADKSIPVGVTSQFIAAGTYSDGTSWDITSSVAWSSGTTSVASVSAGGLAGSTGIGSTLIRATSGSISGSTTLTVTSATTEGTLTASVLTATCTAQVIVQTSVNGTYHTPVAFIEASGIASGPVGSMIQFSGDTPFSYDFQGPPQTFNQAFQCGNWDTQIPQGAGIWWGGYMCTRDSGNPETTTWSGSQTWLGVSLNNNDTNASAQVSPSIYVFPAAPNNMTLLDSAIVTCVP